MGGGRVNLLPRGEGLHQMIEQGVSLLVVEQLGAQEVVVGTFRAAVDPAHQLAIPPPGFFRLPRVAHYPSHTRAVLALGIVDKVDDGYGLHLLRS